MNKLERNCYYMNLDAEERKMFDVKRVEYNYKTKTDMLTSLARMIIYDTYDGAPPEIANAMKGFRYLNQTGDKIKDAAYSILDEHGYAVLAMRGAEEGCRVLLPDIKKMLYEKIHLVPDDNYIRHLVKIYCDVHHTDFTQYRYDRFTEQYEEEYGCTKR